MRNHFRVLLRCTLGVSFLLISPLMMNKHSSIHAQQIDLYFPKPSDTPVEVVELINKSKYHYYWSGNFSLADSLACEAIRLAESTFNTNVILYSLNHYLSMYELGFINEKAIEIAARADRIAVEIADPVKTLLTNVFIANAFRALFRYDEALSYAHKALALSESQRNPSLKALGFLTVGEVLQSTNRFVEAFQYYLNALAIAESQKDNALLIKCYNTLSRFYLITKGFNKAVSYKLMEKELINSAKVVDSVALVWVWCDLEEIASAENRDLNMLRLYFVIDFAERKSYNHLKQYVLAFLRSHLINMGLFEELKHLYIERYPSEFDYLSVHQPLIFYRVKAIIHEVGGLHDSAIYYYNKSWELLIDEPNKVLKANFFIRYGEFLSRQKRYRDAREKFLKGYDLASGISYPEFAIKAANALVLVYEAQGDYQNAFKYLVAANELEEQMNPLGNRDELLSLEIQNAAHLQELAQREAHEERNRRYNIQYSLIMLIIAILFLIMLILGSYRVSPTVIHLSAFVSFILLFEFFKLLVDKQTYLITQGEPLKVIGIKIVLISIMLPLHHWVHKKVVHYYVRKRVSLRQVASNAWTSLRKAANEIWMKWD